MNTPNANSRDILYLLGELPGDEAAAVKAEIERDAAAQRELEATQRLLGELDTTLAAPLGAEELADRIVAELDVNSTSPARVPTQVAVGRFAPLAIVLCVLLALGAWWFWPGRTVPSIVEDDPRPSPPSLSKLPKPVIVQLVNWQITPAGEAEFEIIEPTLVRLDRGELLFESRAEETGNLRNEAQASLRIQTPVGEAVARGRRFIIGTHQLPAVGPTTHKESAMLRSLTRVLVLSGVVTLTTALGSVEGTSGDLLAAESDQAPTKLAVQANSDFAWDLYQQLAKEKEHEGKNLIFSPYSISSALAMTAEGARGRTAREMGAVLRFPEATRRIGPDAQQIPWETARIHTGMDSINRRLNRGSSHYQLHVANALWGEKTFPWRPQFVKALNGPYGAALKEADFINNSERERRRINQWVEAHTDKRIKDVLPEGILDWKTRLVLTNAIYFKGNWSQPFNAKSTRELPFTLANGEKTKSLMMIFDPDGVKHKRGKKPVWPFGYAALDAKGKPANHFAAELQILEMPYAGKELSMFVLLPARHDGLPELEKQLNQQQLDRWLASVKKQEVAVWMPKFKMETEYELVPVLDAMGMPSAFGPGGFTGMSDSPKARSLLIRNVRHKAFVEVNEKGTEAAAATAVHIGVVSQHRYPIFAATRPFIFLIRDNETGSILFAGRMMAPTAR